MAEHEAVSHTPGPWTYDYETSSTVGYMILTPDIGVVAHIWPDEGRGITGATVEANARLIAAAPDLLEALRLAAVWTNPDSLGVPSEAEYAIVLAAIAKAEGREP